jgi:RNA polymerase sigma-70 factor (ECF subfamily)
MSEPSDPELVERIARRDTEALAALWDRHAPHCLALATRIVGDRTLGEDVLQEVFVRVWEEPERYSAARGSVGAWLISSVRSRAIDRLRRQGARERATERAGEGAPRFATAPGRPSSTVAMAVQLLPLEQRQVIELAYFEGLTQTEIAERLALPLGTVKSRLRLGMGKLREAFEEMAGGARP